ACETSLLFSMLNWRVFNTDKNHSVVQTRNETLYKSCDYDDSGLDDTIDWSAAAPEFSKDAVTAAVPLLKEGNTYFFSGNYDGEQCENGQRFAIAVAHGQGLPPDLRPPVADAPGPAAGPDSADRAPAFDFSHPKNVSTPSDASASDDETSTSTSDSTLNLVSLGAGLIVALTVLFVVQV
uniref:Phytocyanin domain-containing protein n=1 Tax=Aegilops tauschii subsp. strangulata TaxID=200361 RepID=A0A453EEY6_AEGTS